MKILLVFLIAMILRGEENYILKYGNSLSPEFQKIAIELHIKNPLGIRILVKEKILGFGGIRGLAINRGILIKKECMNDKATLIHELVHIKQYQDCGGLVKFLKRYINEMIKYGYWQSPLEIEARTYTEQLKRSKNE